MECTLKRQKKFSCKGGIGKDLAILNRYIDSKHDLNDIINTMKKNGKIFNALSLKTKLSHFKNLYLTYNISLEKYIYVSLFPINTLYDKKLAEKHEHSKLTINQNLIGNHMKDKLYLALLREYGLDNIARMINKDVKNVENMYERGRVTFNPGNKKRDTQMLALKDSIFFYENESILAAKQGAYLSAIISLGAALEAVLIYRCLMSKEEAIRAYNLLNSDNTKKRTSPLDWSLSKLIKVCEKAKFLTVDNENNMNISTTELMEAIKIMRNYIHPGKRLKEMPLVIHYEHDFKFIIRIYRIIVNPLKIF